MAKVDSGRQTVGIVHRSLNDLVRDIECLAVSASLREDISKPERERPDGRVTRTKVFAAPRLGFSEDVDLGGSSPHYGAKRLVDLIEHDRGSDWCEPEVGSDE
jgi:hypothetical protein